MKTLSDNFLQSVKVTDAPKLYIDISKLINGNNYLLINIPEVAAKRSAYELGILTGESAGPIKTPFGYEVGRGQFTINWMINNYGVTPFEFANWRDTIEVAELVMEYVEQLSSREEKLNDEETVYLLKASEFGAMICEVAKRLASIRGLNTTGKSIFDKQRTQKFKDIITGKHPAAPSEQQQLISTAISTRDTPVVNLLTGR